MGGGRLLFFVFSFFFLTNQKIVGDKVVEDLA